jgi:hypothetical protein
MPNIGERWDKVESTEKEVKVLRDDIKKSDRNSRIAIYIGIAALIVAVIGVFPILAELFK